MRDPAPWRTRYMRMVLFALMFGLVSQYLLVGVAAGISVLLFVACFYGLFLYSVQGRLGGFERWRGQLSSGWLLTIPIFMLALTYAIYANQMFRVLNVPALFALIVAQTVLLTRRSELSWHRIAFYFDLMYLSFIRPLLYIATPFIVVYDRLTEKGESGTDSARRSTVIKMVWGLLLAAPLLLIVVSLLASADSIFAAWLNEIPNRVGSLISAEAVFRIIVGGVLGWYAFCYIWSLMFRETSTAMKRGMSGRPTNSSVQDGEAAHVKQDNHAMKSSEPSITNTGESVVRAENSDAAGTMHSRSVGKDAWGNSEREPAADQLWKPYPHEPIRIDPVTASTFLVAVNAVYALFVFIQFSYLFGAAGGLLPEGAAYADYARRGFAELVLVALLNIGMLLAGLHFIKRTSERADRIRKGLLTVLIGCTVVMLVSAYSRLSLYEDAYGFTQTRLLVHGFMIYLGLLLLVAVYRIWREHFSLAKVYIVISIAAYLIMNYVNIDARIAERNIARFEQSERIDMDYLSLLSVDAAPALSRLHERHPELAGLGEILSHMRTEAAQDHQWQSWNWSKRQARE